MSSRITTDLAVDKPLEMGHGYSFDTFDRRYIDEQIRGCEEHLVDLVIGGLTGSYLRLSGSVTRAVPFDIACLSGQEPKRIVQATTAGLAGSAGVIGVILDEGIGGESVRVAWGGTLPRALTGMPQQAGFVRLDLDTGRPEWVSALEDGDIALGRVSAAGDWSLIGFGGTAEGGGGGALLGDAVGPADANEVQSITGLEGTCAVKATLKLAAGMSISGTNADASTSALLSLQDGNRVVVGGSGAASITLGLPVVTCLYAISPSSDTLTVGDAACLAIGSSQITKAILPAIAFSAGLECIITEAPSNGYVRGAISGPLPASITGLPTGSGPSYVRVNILTGRLERVAAFADDDVQAGRCDSAGTLSLGQKGGIDVGAGAGLTKTGTRLDVVANADGSIVVNADDIQVGQLATNAQHGNRGGGALHAVATTSVAGFMAAADKTKLDGIDLAEPSTSEPYSAGRDGLMSAADKAKLDDIEEGAKATDPTPLALTAPANVTRASAAIGISGYAARADHKHDIATAAPVALSPGNSATEGVTANLARADHVHGLPAFGTTSGTFCQGNDPRLGEHGGGVAVYDIPDRLRSIGTTGRVDQLQVFVLNYGHYTFKRDDDPGDEIYPWVLNPDNQSSNSGQWVHHLYAFVATGGSGFANIDEQSHILEVHNAKRQYCPVDGDRTFSLLDGNSVWMPDTVFASRTWRLATAGAQDGSQIAIVGKPTNIGFPITVVDDANGQVLGSVGYDWSAQTWTTAVFEFRYGHWTMIHWSETPMPSAPTWTAWTSGTSPRQVSPGQAVYQSEMPLKLTIHAAAVAGRPCTVYYTTNGAAPTPASASTIDGAIISLSFSQTITFRAMSVAGACGMSTVTTASYDFGSIF